MLSTTDIFVRLYMRLNLFTVFISTLLLYGCGGSNNDTSPLPNQTLLVEKSTPILSNNISGLWELNQPITIKFNSTTVDQPDLPNSGYSFSHNSVSTQNYFGYDDDGFITVYAIIEKEFESKNNDTFTEKCIHIEPQVEEWRYLHDHRYRVFNESVSVEVDIQANDDALLISHQNGTSRYKRLASEAFESLYACEDSTFVTPLILGTASKRVKSVDEVEGLWRITQHINSISIGSLASGPIASDVKYLDLDAKGNGKVWLYDDMHQCLIETHKEINLVHDGYVLSFQRVFGDQVISADVIGRLMSINTHAGYNGEVSSSKNLYLYPIIDEDSTEPYFYTDTGQQIDVDIKRCTLSTDEINELDAVEFYDDITGVWAIIRPNSKDEKYIAIDDELIMTLYDYRGDSINNGSGCYKKMRSSQLGILGDNKFEETVNDNLNGIVSLYKTEDRGLVISSQERYGDKYNRLLKRQPMLEETGITPICPSVRN